MITSWIMSIAGVCLLTVLGEVILPDGKTKIIIKKVFSFVLILTIVLPLPKLVHSDFQFDNFSSDESIELQEDYLFQLNRYKIDQLATTIENIINSDGVSGVEISISADIFTTEHMQIEWVFVELFDLVISSETSHSDIQKEIVQVILNYVDINEERIVFNE